MVAVHASNQYMTGRGGGVGSEASPSLISRSRQDELGAVCVGSYEARISPLTYAEKKSWRERGESISTQWWADELNQAEAEDQLHSSDWTIRTHSDPWGVAIRACIRKDEVVLSYPRLAAVYSSRWKGDAEL